MSRTAVAVLALVFFVPCDCRSDDASLTNSLGMKLVRVAPGKFVMGAGEAPPRSRAEWLTRDWDESPAHAVTITNAFHIGAYEVTNAQYEQFDPKHKEQHGTAKADEPVVFVTWKQAVEFCAWLSKKEGRTYRLPTEAEWEYVCRAGTSTPFSTGATLTAEQANFGPEGPKPVGSFKPNAWGLYDTHGNVAEWCADWHGPYEAGEQTDPVGRADGYARVCRGWSWQPLKDRKDGPRHCRSANRSGLLPEDANRFTGFRVVLGEPPAPRPLPAVLPPVQKDVKQTPADGKAPDPSRPFFLDYNKEGKSPKMPKDAWGPVFAQHNHFAAVCVCPNGDVLAAWYTTVNEPGRELAQAASRLRAGSDRWDDVAPFFDVPDVNDHAPVLFRDDKRIYHFCTQSLRNWDYASDIVRYSDDSGATWSRPAVMLPRDDPKALSQPCSALRTKDGVLVLACDGDLHRDERLLISRDGGKTWTVGGGDMRQATGKYAIHPAIARRDDGAILSFLRGPSPMPVAVTKDLGETWEVRPTPFPGLSGGMKAAALKLASGALLLCSIDSGKKLVGGGTFAALSLDDGKSWAHVRKIDAAVGGYMAVAQGPDGVIHLFGTKVTCVSFNEAWVKEGEPLPSEAPK